MSTMVTLPRITFRRDESKTLVHRLKVNGVAENLTGWTLELYVDGQKLKTITTASDAATQGRIKDQDVSPGEYYFTILESDLVPLVGSTRSRELQAYVRYVAPDVSPPRVFSNVEFSVIVVR